MYGYPPDDYGQESGAPGGKGPPPPPPPGRGVVPPPPHMKGVAPVVPPPPHMDGPSKGASGSKGAPGKDGQKGPGKDGSGQSEGSKGGKDKGYGSDSSYPSGHQKGGKRDSSKGKQGGDSWSSSGSRWSSDKGSSWSSDSAGWDSKSWDSGGKSSGGKSSGGKGSGGKGSGGKGSSSWDSKSWSSTDKSWSSEGDAWSSSDRAWGSEDWSSAKDKEWDSSDRGSDRRGGKGSKGKTKGRANARGQSAGDKTVKFDLDWVSTALQGLQKTKTRDASAWKSQAGKITEMLMADGCSKFLTAAKETSELRQQLVSALHEGCPFLLRAQREKVKERMSGFGIELDDGAGAGAGAARGRGSKDKQQDRGRGKGGKKGSTQKLGRFGQKLKRGFGRRQGNKGDPDDPMHAEDDEGATGANTIEVKWKPPGKATDGDIDEADEETGAEPTFADKEESKEKSPSPVRRGPAGRGRGTSAPAWMTKGIGNTAASGIESNPGIEVEDQAKEEQKAKMVADLDEIFADRSTDVPERGGKKGRKKGKKGKGKGKKHDAGDDKQQDEDGSIDDADEEDEPRGGEKGKGKKGKKGKKGAAQKHDRSDEKWSKEVEWNSNSWDKKEDWNRSSDSWSSWKQEAWSEEDWKEEHTNEKAQHSTEDSQDLAIEDSGRPVPGPVPAPPPAPPVPPPLPALPPPPVNRPVKVSTKFTAFVAVEHRFNDDSLEQSAHMAFGAAECADRPPFWPSNSSDPVYRSGPAVLFAAMPTEMEPSYPRDSASTLVPLPPSAPPPDYLMAQGYGPEDGAAGLEWQGEHEAYEEDQMWNEEGQYDEAAEEEESGFAFLPTVQPLRAVSSFPEEEQGMDGDMQEELLEELAAKRRRLEAGQVDSLDNMAELMKEVDALPQEPPAFEAPSAKARAPAPNLASGPYQQEW